MLIRRYEATEKRYEMITVIVRFKLPTNVDAAGAAGLFRDSAPKYERLAGLVRKYYLYDAEVTLVAAATYGEPRSSGAFLWR